MSAYLLFYYTRSLSKAWLQLLDVTFLQTLNINWHLKSDDPNTFQVYLQSLEASFEAAPQCVIQFVFLSRTNSLQTLTLVSLLFSVYSIISTVVKDDKSLFIESARNQQFKSPCIVSACDIYKYENYTLAPTKARICFISWEF